LAELLFGRLEGKTKGNTWDIIDFEGKGFSYGVITVSVFFEVAHWGEGERRCRGGIRVRIL